MTEQLRDLHVLNATGKPRVATFEGREHLVVPVVSLIGDNVIHAVNAPEAEFVPARALTTRGWDGRPLMLGHPTDENGNQISANDPSVIERQGFGFMAATRLNGKRLGTEAWCDVKKLEALGAQQMLADLRAGKPIEVSVGAFVRTRAAAGVANGKAYKTEWAELAPDHLAFLPSSTGACSVAMGCGANRMAMRIMEGSNEMKLVTKVETKSTAAETMSQAANAASKSAWIEGTPEAHSVAADLHGAAQKAFNDIGLDVRSVQHADQASAHQQEVQRLQALGPNAGVRNAQRSIIDPETLRLCRDIPQSERDEMPSDDFAGPDESFPIKTQADVDAAKRLIGHAKDPDAVKRKIIAIAKRKGLKVPDAWQPKAAQLYKMLQRFFKAAEDGTPDDESGFSKLPYGLDEDDERGEAIAYESMKAMLDSAADQIKEAAGHVDELIGDPGLSDEEEDARLNAVRMAAYSAVALLNNVCSVTFEQQTPDLPAQPTYLEAIRTAIGKAISAKNMKTIQKAHDASHEMHAHTVALGAQCNGMKLLEAAGEGIGMRAACGCSKENDMNTSERVAAIKEIAGWEGANFTEAEVKGLALLSDKGLATLRAAAGKSKADAIIQAKHAADSALAGHAVGLNAKDDAEAAAARAKAKDDDEGEKRAAALKAAQAAGFATVEEHEEARWLDAHPGVKAVVEAARKAEAGEKAQLVAGLKTLGALTEEQLKAKTIEQLRELAAFARVQPIDQTGRTFPLLAAEHGADDVYSNPPDPYAEALKQRRALAGAKAN